ncbi:phage tail protein [Pseudomonas koreensis]|uniref:phage tail protein n=1 Tax=Pseudomonas koreensis TaxID=198620 RepID=UPI003F827C1F
MEKQNYPLPIYRYKVAIDGVAMDFQSVSGLETSFKTIEYKVGGAPNSHTTRIAGQQDAININLKKGIFQKDSFLYDWLKTCKGSADGKDVTVSLLDAAGIPLITWNVRNAFPTKLSAPGFDGSSNEVAIEEMTLVADSMEVNFA